jgi:hypothetical protein
LPEVSEIDYFVGGEGKMKILHYLSGRRFNYPSLEVTSRDGCKKYCKVIKVHSISSA